jgi:competence protein ComEC
MQQWQILKHSGTAHLIAISGLHIGLLLHMLQALILRLIYRWCIINPFIISACISTSILLLYAMIAGMSPSCLRAVTMAVMRCMQLMHYQRSHTLQNALICFILHAIIKPEHIAQIGFQLSYGMVISLLWLPKLLPTALKPYERWLSTPIISAFWSYAYWQNITLSAPLANSIAIPWVSYILLPLTLLASCLGILHQASGVYLHQYIDFQWHFLFTILKNLNAYLPCLDLSSKQ